MGLRLREVRAVILETKSALSPIERSINDHFGSDVVKRYYDPRNKSSVPSITGRIEGGADGIKAVMTTVFGSPVTVEKLAGESAARVSRTYDSFLVSTSSGSFYFRSILRSLGSLTGKDLSPGKVGLAGRILTKENALAIISDGISANKDLPLEVLDLAKNLAALAKSPGNVVYLGEDVRELVRALTPSDIKVLGKNFGEVVLAVWYLYNTRDAVSVEFPRYENNPLADFTVNFSRDSGRPPLNVSAKYELGANASLNSIIKPGQELPEWATVEERRAFEAVMAVSHGSIVDGILRAEQILDTKEYRVIRDMVRAAPTLRNISDLVENILYQAGFLPSTNWSDQSEVRKKYEAFMVLLKPFYDATGRAGIPTIQSMRNIVALGHGKYYHPILYAFSASLAKTFNMSHVFTDVLNKAASTIKADQAYLTIGPSSFRVEIKKIESSKFKFSAGAIAYKADNTRIKASLVR